MLIIFWQFILWIWTWKWCHNVIEVSFFHITNFYLFSEIYKKNYSSRNNYGNTFSQKLINKL